ncbi:MAG: hypothetical protein II617_04580 [Firmicutes bacterium]|nr:hypothetical protein [Bacillota bacterium]
MVFLKRSDLCIIKTETILEEVSGEMLADALVKAPCNIVYLETSEGLYGLVSSGDVYRAGGRRIPVNQNFISLGRDETMKAREIFRQNSRIGEIPVICGGRLTGEFHRSDDRLLLDRLPSPDRNAYTAGYLSSMKNTALVEPAPSRPEKMRHFERMRRLLDRFHADYTIVSLEEMVRRIDRFDRILLVDAQEKQGAQLYLYLKTGRRVYHKAVSYCALMDRLESSEVMDCGEFFGNYRKQGVEVFLLTAPRRTSEYFKRTEAELRRRFPSEFNDDLNIKALPYAKTFFDDMAEVPGYVDSILQGYFTVEKDEQNMRLQDMKSPFVNVKSGLRKTACQPEHYDRTIYFFGPCLIIGSYVGDDLTMESVLQKILNQRGISARVVNCGCWGGNVANVSRIASTRFKKGDVIVAMMEDVYDTAEGFRTIDLWDALEENDVPSRWMLDNPFHVNHHVTKVYAEHIFRTLLDAGCLTAPVPEDRLPLIPDSDMIDKLFIRKYFYGVDLDRFKTAACCVINGNPFTFGHKALIERAARETEHVYLLVVREDSSLFSFAERYTMALEALRDLPNVTVIPSGLFVGNAAVFPAYYAKMAEGDYKQQARDHVRAYAAVASKLHATHRYLGEEPDDPTTAEINRACPQILPEYGIETVIVPRFEHDGRQISGSAVRKMAESNDPAIYQLVPKATADIIFCLPVEPC